MQHFIQNRHIVHIVHVSTPAGGIASDEGLIVGARVAWGKTAKNINVPGVGRLGTQSGGLSAPESGAIR